MIGIVILNYETWDVTLQCMESIMEAENEEMIRIYLVDNASHCSSHALRLPSASRQLAPRV